MSLLVKICGLKTPESVECALDAGADMVGFVFHPKSPRYITYDVSKPLVRLARGRAKIVTLTADASYEDLVNILCELTPDMFQLHGNEDAGLIGRLRSEACGNAEVMKAIGVASVADLAAVPAYAAVADRILLDAKPPKDAAYPGGHGKVFDWRVLSALPPDLPFMLSGGLTPENVGGAIRTIRDMGLNLTGVDVSSGVESAPGVKDLGKIRAFIAEVRKADRREADGV